MRNCRTLLIGLIVMSLLSACGTMTNGSCPPLKSYTKAKKEKAAAEIEAMAPDAIIPEFMADYTVLRAMVRRCQLKD